jgi:DNA-binding transcriptional regulator YiaG
MAHIRKIKFGLSQADFAKALGRNQSTISRWESGELEPSRDEMGLIRDLARGNGIPWDDCWFFELPPSATASDAA